VRAEGGGEPWPLLPYPYVVRYTPTLTVAPVRYGAYLLDREHWPRAFACVSALASALSVPVTAKIRLLPTLEETLAFAAGLQVRGRISAILQTDILFQYVSAALA
jgi:hypothetical protein